MKIREGFVSNSSSSSFVLIGKKIDTISDLKTAKNPQCLGGYLSDGRDVFKLTKEMIDFICGTEEYFDDNNYELVDVLFYAGEEVKIPVSELVSSFGDYMGELYIVTGEADYYSTEGLKEFIENYYED